MIQAHLFNIEQTILQQSKVQDISGHTLHKGTPREIFIKNFLENHLGKTVNYGTGEIIDCDSKPNESRNQHDIIIYKNEFPKIDLTGGISAFFAESVLATIEVKSNIDYSEFLKAFIAARRCKELKREYYNQYKFYYTPPNIINYIVAYNGPKNMRTIHRWILKAMNSHSLKPIDLSKNDTDRKNISSHAVDGIFVLGKGFVHFDNFLIDALPPEIRKEKPGINWIIGDMGVGSLLLLFLNLAQIICIPRQNIFNFMPYLQNKMDGKIQTEK